MDISAAEESFTRSFLVALRPEPKILVSEWADANRVVAPEASPMPGPWRTDVVPYMREIMDRLSPSDPVQRVVFKKSSQVAGTECALNWLGMIIDVAPGPAMIVEPTVDLGKALNREKFKPMVRATPVLRAKVTEQRSAQGASTALFKNFKGGFLILTGANSAAGLALRSVRFLLKDEVDRYPVDVAGEGDPYELADKRTQVFRNKKIFELSTPTTEGLSRIGPAYQNSDQRQYHVPCPHCEVEQVLEFKNLKWEKDRPETAAFWCVHCGVEIGHEHKAWMTSRGRWVPQNPGHSVAGYCIWQAYSPFSTWAEIVEAWLRAKSNPQKLKVFVNTVLGEEWKDKGDAPPHETLFNRREDYPVRVVPPGGLFLTAGVDVQMDRLEIEVVAWGIGKESWSVDYAVLWGDTAQNDVWKQLDQVYGCKYRDWQGKDVPVAMMFVDAGYNTQMVYRWARARPNAEAVKGMAGHMKPIVGIPTKQDVTIRGAKIKGGAMLWPLGTWPIKAELYGYLRLQIDEDGSFPSGFCHWPLSYEEAYFKGLTAERLITRERKGYAVTEWVLPSGVRNEQLDCRVYAMAAAHHLGIDRMTNEQWRALAAERGAPPEQAQASLDKLWSPSPADSTGHAEEGPPEMDGPDEDWLGERTDNWLN